MHTATRAGGCLCWSCLCWPCHLLFCDHRLAACFAFLMPSALALQTPPTPRCCGDGVWGGVGALALPGANETLALVRTEQNRKVTHWPGGETRQLSRPIMAPPDWGVQLCVLVCACLLSSAVYGLYRLPSGSAAFIPGARWSAQLRGIAHWPWHQQPPAAAPVGRRGASHVKPS